jgi:hypothetical protein
MPLLVRATAGSRAHCLHLRARSRSRGHARRPRSTQGVQPRGRRRRPQTGLGGRVQRAFTRWAGRLECEGVRASTIRRGALRLGRALCLRSAGLPSDRLEGSPARRERLCTIQASCHGSVLRRLVAAAAVGCGRAVGGLWHGDRWDHVQGGRARQAGLWVRVPGRRHHGRGCIRRHRGSPAAARGDGGARQQSRLVAPHKA